MYLIYAHRMGIKAGGVSSNNHEITWVYIDGKLYYYDLQDAMGSGNETWDWYKTLDYNEDHEGASFGVAWKWVPDPTGRYLNVPSDCAEAMEKGEITKIPLGSFSRRVLLAYREAGKKNITRNGVW